ncbi:MAG: hypothetical protein AAF281_05925 [Pseudomonadota bacterium]
MATNSGPVCIGEDATIRVNPAPNTTYDWYSDIALTNRIGTGSSVTIRNVTMAVREHEGQVIFLHEVQEGAADRSYGVQVARLAGLPTDVVERARAVLDRLESADRGQGAQVLIDDLPLFRAAPVAPPPAPAETPLRDRLVSVAPDALSPREALDLVYELKALADDPG